MFRGIGLDQRRGEDGVAELGVRFSERQKRGLQTIAFGSVQLRTHGDDMGRYRPLFGNDFEAGPLFGRQVFVFLKNIVAHGSGLGLPGKNALDGAGIAGAEPHVSLAKECRRVVLDKAFFVEINERDEVARGARPAREGNWFAAQVFHGGVGLLFEREPITGVIEPPVDLADEQQPGGTGPLGMHHVGRAQVAGIDRSVGEAFDDDRASGRDDDLHLAAKFLRQRGGKRFPLFKHGIRILVRLEGNDEIRREDRCGGEKKRKKERFQELRSSIAHAVMQGKTGAGIAGPTLPPLCDAQSGRGMRIREVHMKPEELWFKDAVIYELHVRSFADGSGDGIGDFAGLREKLGYFEDLGVTALWLLPFYPSPLRDDGYDIADYLSVNSSYGTLDDFRAFLDEAHRRNLRVITELVINHTSDQHPWFQAARQAPPGSPERDFYVWSDTPQRYEEARIIFKDFESSNWAWDPVAKAYYWHRFYSHQPDLNFDNPRLRNAVFETLDFWLEMGVDGLRLDAVPYLFERDGTSCENLPETHAFLRELRRHVDAKFPGRMLLAEANQWPEDAVAYFGKGDECHMEFHFPLMPRLFMALQMEDRFPLIDILDQTPAIPDNCQWAIFLRNHDELTLEMVTDEERDYMVRIYAEDARARINLGIRRRLAPLLGNNRRKIELINALLLSLPGTPILYYGDEIGMGDNFYLGDRHGVRTPMQWSADRNAGFSRANPQQLFLPVNIDPEFHYEAVNVDVQQKNLSSLLWWMRRILAVRQRHAAFAHGTMEFLPSENAKVLSFLRRHGDETILVVANLARFSQGVALDLSAFRGWHPEELFGGTSLPAIGDTPYLFTLAPHGFYWLRLQPDGAETGAESEAPVLNFPAEWSGALVRKLEREVLPRYLRGCRWFGGKQRTMRDVRLIEGFTPPDGGAIRVAFVEVTFAEGSPSLQVLPLAIGTEADGEPGPNSMVARFAGGEVLWDALYIPSVRQRLAAMIESGEVWSSNTARLLGSGRAGEVSSVASRLLRGEQSNSSMLFEERAIFKFLRRFEAGPHPDADILRALARQDFPHVPTYLGEIRCRRDGREGIVGLLTSYVPNQGDGWSYALDSLGRFFERALADDGTADWDELIGAVFPERMRQLGQRTGALHVALEKILGEDFVPESFTGLYQRSLYQALRSSARRTELELGQKLRGLPPEVQEDARGWMAEGPRLLARYATLLGRRIPAKKIRVHGDYHLGQVLNTGRDFVILDFEGEPRRTLGERLLKRPPLVDVAGMLRSFDYAVQAALDRQRLEDRERLAPWVDRWRARVSRAFLEGYLDDAAESVSLPQNPGDFEYLLDIFLLDKAVYEIGYELSYRPDFLHIPLRAARRMLLEVEQGKSPQLEAEEPRPTTGEEPGV